MQSRSEQPMAQHAMYEDVRQQLADLRIGGAPVINGVAPPKGRERLENYHGRVGQLPRTARRSVREWRRTPSGRRREETDIPEVLTVSRQPFAYRAEVPEGRTKHQPSFADVILVQNDAFS